jgi:phosphoribosylformylglycinamidine cyclo-ligase
MADNTYKSAGVDIQAGDETVDKIKGHAKSTFTKGVITGIGHFGAFFKPDFSKYNDPVLVSSVDGVGTKLKIAFMTGIHNTVGQDIVNHCVDDIAVCGAEPLYFMDYLAFGKLIPEKAGQIVEGLAKACRENNCALVGGETAEMPGLYAEDEYDISGTITGIVDRERIVNGSTIKKGDVLIGFASNGLHTNGYSLARKVLFEKFKLSDTPDLLDTTLAEELLKVHKSYLRLIRTILESVPVKGFSHITGGGIVGNTSRILPEKLDLNIDWNAWDWLPVFQLIQQTGKISNDEMKKVFNLGIGLICVAGKSDADSIINAAESIGEKGVFLGEVI